MTISAPPLSNKIARINPAWMTARYEYRYFCEREQQITPYPPRFNTLKDMLEGVNQIPTFIFVEKSV